MQKSLVREILAHLVTCAPRMMVSSLFIPYGQSLGRALRELEEEAARCPHDFSNRSPTTVSVTLHRMKKQKLVSMSGPKKKAVWRITQKGKHHFREMKDPRSEFDLPPEDDKTRLFVFDIPENRKGDRNWLRRELIACDYTPLQKSVFMGLRPLSAKLLEALKSRELLSHIHIVGLEDDLD